MNKMILNGLTAATIGMASVASAEQYTFNKDTSPQLSTLWAKALNMGDLDHKDPGVGAGTKAAATCAAPGKITKAKKKACGKDLCDAITATTKFIKKEYKNGPEATLTRLNMFTSLNALCNPKKP